MDSSTRHSPDGPPAWMGTIKQGVLLFFVAVFVVILLRLVLSRSDRYRKAARIPLDDHEVVEPRRTEE